MGRGVRCGNSRLDSPQNALQRLWAWFEGLDTLKAREVPKIGPSVRRGCPT
jgi:hypothetical protein